MSFVDGLGTSYACSFLASTHLARFYKELNKEISKFFGIYVLISKYDQITMSTKY